MNDLDLRAKMSQVLPSENQNILHNTAHQDLFNVTADKFY